jgi:hypothetical protein
LWHAISPSFPFQEFVEKIAAQFGKKSEELLLKFKYDDGAKITLQDSGDRNMAIETARVSAKGSPTGKFAPQEPHCDTNKLLKLPCRTTRQVRFVQDFGALVMVNNKCAWRPGSKAKNVVKY